jgi:hypothetical protein
VKEIINLPDYAARNKSDTTSLESVVLPQPVVDQLRKYVTNVAASYNANPFHNFEHASHVAMAVSKLLSRIVAPADIDPDDSLAELGKALHDHTYGITSDPLTQFACVFSALIHDGACFGGERDKSHTALFSSSHPTLYLSNAQWTIWASRTPSW